MEEVTALRLRTLCCAVLVHTSWHLPLHHSELRYSNTPNKSYSCFRVV